MEHRQLGLSGLELSVFGMGTMTFGDESDESASRAMLDRFVAAGGTFIDTADVYAAGASEEIIGRWLATRGGPEGLVLATKARFPTGDGPDDRGAGRRHLEQALEASLRRLGVEVIDLYQIHGWDPDTPIEETLATLNDFVEKGKVKYIGLSNMTGWQLLHAILVARHEGWAPIVSLQPQYNLLARQVDLDLLPICLEQNVGVLPWSPLGGGWLAGKYSPDQVPTGTTRLGEEPDRGVESYFRRNRDRTWAIVDEVRSVAKERGVEPSQVALAWLRQRPGITSVILGARTVAQLSENLAAVDLTLDPDEVARLNRISDPGLPEYPHRFIEDLCGYDMWKELGVRPNV
ncbi:MAG TPA: aldo/keto reductase [Acidimicrobiia bacterium]|nr:aldo/keto reductase [Acidimicrobiia bacterium]